MNKSELVDAVSKEAGVTKKIAQDVLDGFFATVTNELASGNQVQLVGFGTFSTSKRAARTGRNPQTGEEIKIAERTVPALKFGKAVKDACNS